MKVYFTASIVGKKHYLSSYLKIIDILKAKKFEIIYDHIISTTPDIIRSENKEELLKYQQKLEKWIKESDFIIAETSFPSISVGFEISLALSLGKPVLILYCAGHPPSLLAHHSNEKLACEKYSPDTVKDIIDEFINYVRGTNDTRFTFFITSEIASFLNKISNKQKLPKSVYLRKLIEREMKTPHNLK